MSAHIGNTPRGQAGFTMIELVVVIILLGILAATALPRFIGMSAEARSSALEGLQGALVSGASMAHAKCRFVDGCDETGWSSALVTSPDGLSGRMFNGYPTSNASSNSSHITRWVNVDGFDVNTSSVLFTDFSFADAPDSQQCRVRYNYSQTKGSPPNVELLTAGC